MAVESPESIEIEEQRAELKTVLASPGFARAPALAGLLSYLCEKLFAGEAHQIKEYSIGLEVFRRGTTFDQDSDSIVRVEANRLRRRLAAYYEGEGSRNRLRIVIPVGQYVPRFERRETEGKSEKKDASSGMPGAPSARRIAHARLWGWLAGAIFGMLVIAGSAWHFYRQKNLTEGTARNQEQNQALTTISPVPAAAPYSEPSFGPPVGQEVRILAGSSRGFVDHAGKLWGPDAWFTGGTAVKSSVEQIWRTQDPSFYRTSRQGRFRYDIPLRKGVYELHLLFAETVFGPESTGTGGEGSRIMTVRANGQPLLTGFDVAADAGASYTADVKVFPDITPAADGKLHLEFSAEDGQQAILSAIEILPGIPGRIRPVRVLARQTPYYSNDSHWWSPDDYFEGGRLASYTAPVTGTDDPEMYETERWGNFSYAIPVSPGTYSVTLYFAARHGAWDETASEAIDGRPPVRHVFNVFCNGKVVLSGFDLAKEAGAKDVAIRRFTDLKPNAQDKLVLNFVPVQGYATVTGIEVLPQ